MSPIAEAQQIQKQEGIILPEREQIPQISKPELAFLAAGVEHKAEELGTRGYNLPDPGFIGPMSDSVTTEEIKKFTGNGKKDIYTARLEIIAKVEKLLEHPNAEVMIQELANNHPDQAELLQFFRSPAAREDLETGKISKKPAIEIFREQVLADQAAAKSQGRL